MFMYAQDNDENLPYTYSNSFWEEGICYNNDDYHIRKLIALRLMGMGVMVHGSVLDGLLSWVTA